MEKLGNKIIECFNLNTIQCIKQFTQPFLNILGTDGEAREQNHEPEGSKIQRRTTSHHTKGLTTIMIVVIMMVTKVPATSVDDDLMI